MEPGTRGRSARVPARAPDGPASQVSTTQDAVARPDIIRQFELTEKVHGYDPKADTGLIDAAYVVAMQAHGAQKREPRLFPCRFASALRVSRTLKR